MPGEGLLLSLRLAFILGLQARNKEHSGDRLALSPWWRSAEATCLMHVII